MDLKHIESLAEDKDLYHAYYVKAFRDYAIDESKWEFEEDVPREWDSLSDEEKARLLGWADYFSRKFIVDDWTMCQVLMEYQDEVLLDSWGKDDFWDAYTFLKDSL